MKKNKIVDEKEFEKMINDTKELKLDKIKLKDKNLNIYAIIIQKIYRGYISKLS
jgi:hypothetical protein